MPDLSPDQVQALLIRAEQQLTHTRAAMAAIVEEYQQVFSTAPVVFLRRHTAAGVTALRWRKYGTQCFVELTDAAVHALLLDEQRRVNRRYRIGHYDLRRIQLNHDFAMAFHTRARLNRLQARRQAIYRSGLL